MCYTSFQNYGRMTPLEGILKLCLEKDSEQENNHEQRRAKQRERKEKRDGRVALLLTVLRSILAHLENFYFFTVPFFHAEWKWKSAKCLFLCVVVHKKTISSFSLTFSLHQILAPRRFGVKVLHDDDDVGVNGIWKCRMSRRNLYLRDLGFPPKCKATKGFQVFFQGEGNLQRFKSTWNWRNLLASIVRLCFRWKIEIM